MEILKKYWWAFALIIVLLFLFFISEATGENKLQEEKKQCKKISSSDFEWKKSWYADRNGGDWNAAYYSVLKEGYCEPGK